MDMKFQKLSCKHTLKEGETPLKEYPRPQLVRDSFINLNGYWNYAITKDCCQEPTIYDGKILVPFSPECQLSEVNKVVLPDDVLWYKKEIKIQKSFNNGLIILHFGAVDQTCEVFINGQTAFKNEGGYYPFSIDITDLAELVDDYYKFDVVVKVTDKTDTSYYENGKQRLKRGGIWYTPQSGIWQTVWIESVPLDYIERIKQTPDVDNNFMRFDIERSGKFNNNDITVWYNGDVVYKNTFEVDNFEVVLDNVKLWSPDTPNLYDYQITSGQDTIRGYFGMRKIEIRNNENNVKVIYLNNEPYLNNGLLDQGYYPESLYTPPTDEAMIYDIQVAKELGFNMLRKHIKIEPLRWYYHADKIGMLVWQDMISGGEKYNPFVTMYLPFTVNRKIKDSKYKLFGRADERGRQMHYQGLNRMIEHLYNITSIVCWVPFNEGWGQFDSKVSYNMVKELDETRLIDHASGWHDQGCGDFESRHIYFTKLQKAKDKTRSYAITEFGGYSYKIDEYSFNLSKTFGYKLFNDRNKFNDSLKALYEEQVMPLVKSGCSALVYTQLTDVEDETNGIMTYDRKVIKVDKDMMREINERAKNLL